MTAYAHTWAEISDDNQYRYVLGRQWNLSPGQVVTWVMLNPSTADAVVDDATIRRCVGFSHAWGFRGLYVVNLFALRTRDPKQLRAHPDPVGPANTEWVDNIMASSDQVVAAWGTSWPANQIMHVASVASLADSYGAVCLGKTKSGQPRHPLYLPAVTERIPF